MKKEEDWKKTGLFFGVIFLAGVVLVLLFYYGLKISTDNPRVEDVDEEINGLIDSWRKGEIQRLGLIEEVNNVLSQTEDYQVWYSQYRNSILELNQRTQTYNSPDIEETIGEGKISSFEELDLDNNGIINRFELNNAMRLWNDDGLEDGLIYEVIDNWESNKDE